MKNETASDIVARHAEQAFLRINAKQGDAIEYARANGMEVAFGPMRFSEPELRGDSYHITVTQDCIYRKVKP